MRAFSSFLLGGVLGVTAHDMTAKENMYFMDTLSNFLHDFESAYASEEVMKFPSCVNNALTYESSYASMGCDTSICSTTAITTCCNGMQKWSSKQEGCENYMGFYQECCAECSDVNSPGYSHLCSTDSEQIMGGINCNSSPLTTATGVFVAGTPCVAGDVVVDGTYYVSGVQYSSSTCDKLMEKIFDDEASGQSVFNMMETDPDLMGMLHSGALSFRSTNVGSVSYTVGSKCNVFLSTHTNGVFASNPTNVSYADGMAPMSIAYNSTVYNSGAPALFYQGKHIIVGGTSWGQILVDTADMVKIGKFKNYGHINVANSMDLAMNNISNHGVISLVNVMASVDDFYNHPPTTLSFDGQYVLATNVSNEGIILIKSGTTCILDVYMNYGSITIEDGAHCDVYLNVNEHTGHGVLNLPASGVTVHQGVYVPPVKEPLVEAFGKWTTGAFRAGKSRWVGDETIDHGDCDMFRYNTLGIKSIIQSPSNETFNAIVEISHPKRSVHVDLAYINVTLHDKDSNVWHFSRYLFEDSDVITHLELPQANSNGVVSSSADSFRVIVSIDFDDLNIPGSMDNTVEIDVFSLREARKGLKLDALDCVKLYDVGIVRF